MMLRVIKENVFVVGNSESIAGDWILFIFRRKIIPGNLSLI